MQYYEVLVAHSSYHGSEALTYAYDGALTTGQLVKTPLRGRSVLGIILRTVAQPAFETREIVGVAPYPPLPTQSLSLLRWTAEYYPAPLGAVVRQFVPPTEVFPPTHQQHATSPTSTSLPPLTAEQQAAVASITGVGTFLLHGITGSGKSRVYIELAQRTLATGRSALVLTPEIGLTAQLVTTFRAVFGYQVFVLHSGMTAAERRNVWYDILATTEPVVVIGPRSALFAPVRNLGLVVLDEAHDNAYKNESAPHYQAARVAAKLAELQGATLVLGSATPSIEDYYLATKRNRPIIAMQSLARTNTPLHIEMVDMRERDQFARGPLLSTALLGFIDSALARGEQILLYLNRRGTANVVLCNQCGWQSLCPNCDLALTYHGDAHELRCHVCGYHTTMPTSCPECGNTDILLKSIGTKAVVEAVQKMYSKARIARFDTDVSKADRLDQQLAAIARGEVDIIVGTQMVGKGLDLPKLSVVGIINADSSLLLPDYTAAEQTFQLLAQVVGRVGRGHLPGIVVVQTYNPENPTLQAAVQRDYSNFYNNELHERKTFMFPPFTYLLKLQVLRATAANAEKAAEALARDLAAKHPRIIIDGPTPSFHPKEKGKYSWQLLLKSPSRSELVDIVRTLPSGWTYDIDPINLL